MKFEIKLFKFYGIPVHLKLWFLLLLIWLNPIYVFAIFVSILIHEMAHAFVAHKLGYNVTNIYVDIFNGAAEMDINNIHERDSVKIISAGPISNLFLFSIFTLLYATGFNQTFVWNMAIINALLFLFNMLPIFPMDGGRLLRDSLYLFTKDRSWSFKVSSRISLIFSVSLLVFSILTINILMGIFAVIFIIYACKELGLVS